MAPGVETVQQATSTEAGLDGPGGLHLDDTELLRQLLEPFGDVPFARVGGPKSQGVRASSFFDLRRKMP